MRRLSTRLKKMSSATKSPTRQWRRPGRGLRSRERGRLGRGPPGSYFPKRDPTPSTPPGVERTRSTGDLLPTADALEQHGFGVDETALTATPALPGRPSSNASQILASTSRTDAANHLPPLAVGIPRSLRALAMARSEVAPLACSSAITGARSRPRGRRRPLRWRPRPSGGPSR
jgi:hypothetical protein